MSILMIVRDTLIALALSWVGITLEARPEAARAQSPCASDAGHCTTPQN